MVSHQNNEIITFNEEYRILDYLNSGGQKDVYRVEQLSTGQILALKELGQRRRKDELFRTQMDREATTMARLAHPNIPPVFALKTNPLERPVFVERFIEGKSWADAMGQMTLKENIDLLIRVSGVIAWVHENFNLIHGDLKPDNVMLAGNTAKYQDFYIVDWGMSYSLTPPVSFDKLQFLGGTDDFMPPEVAGALVLVNQYKLWQQRLAAADSLEKKRINKAQLDELTPTLLRYGSKLCLATDVFMLGGILYQILAGTSPYNTVCRNTSMGTVAMNRLRAVIKPIYEAVLPEHQKPPLELVQIANKALAFDPALRYRSAHEFKSALELYNQRMYLFERLEEIWSQSEQIQRQTLSNRTSALLGLNDQLNIIKHSLLEQAKENSHTENPAADPRDGYFDSGQLLQTQIERGQAQICERLIESALLQKDYGLAANQLMFQKERIDQNQQRDEERSKKPELKPSDEQDDEYLLQQHSTAPLDCQTDFWIHREATREQQQDQLQRGLSSQRWAARLKWVAATLAVTVILFGIGMAVQQNLREQDRQKAITAQKDKETAIRMRQLSGLRSRLGQVEEANWGTAAFEIRKQIAKLDPKNAELYAQALIDCQTQLFPVERHDGLKTALAANSSGMNRKSRLKIIPIQGRGEVLAYRPGETVIYRCRDISLEILETISVTPFLTLPGIEGTAPVESRPETLDQALIRQGASVSGDLPKMRSSRSGDATISSAAVPENNPNQFAVGLSNNEILVFNLEKEKTSLDFKILHSAEKLFALSASATIDLKNGIVSRDESYITTSALIFSPDGSQLAIISQFITPQTIHNVTDKPGYRAITNSSGLTGVSVWQVNQRQQTMQMSLELPSKRKNTPSFEMRVDKFRSYAASRQDDAELEEFLGGAFNGNSEILLVFKNGNLLDLDLGTQKAEKLFLDLNLNEETVTSFDFSSDRTQLLLGFNSGLVALAHFHAKPTIAAEITFQSYQFSHPLPSIGMQHLSISALDAEVTATAINPTGEMGLVSFQSGKTTLINLKEQTSLYTLKTEGIYNRFLSDSRLLTFADDGSSCVWDFLHLTKPAKPVIPKNFTYANVLPGTDYLCAILDILDEKEGGVWPHIFIFNNEGLLARSNGVAYYQFLTEAKPKKSCLCVFLNKKHGSFSALDLSDMNNIFMSDWPRKLNKASVKQQSQQATVNGFADFRISEDGAWLAAIAWPNRDVFVINLKVDNPQWLQLNIPIFNNLSVECRQLAFRPEKAGRSTQLAILDSRGYTTLANQEDWNKPICIWSEGVNAFENSGRIEYASSGDYLVNYSPETAQVLDSATGSVVQTLYSQPNRCQQDPSGNLFRHAFTPVELQIPEFSDAFALLDGNGILRFYGKPRQSAKFRFLYAQTGYSLDPLCPFACEGEPGFESAQNGRNWIMSNQNSASHLFYSSQNDALYVANTCGLSKIDMVSIRKQIRLFIQSIRTGRDFNDYYKMASKAASAPEL